MKSCQAAPAPAAPALGGLCLPTLPLLPVPALSGLAWLALVCRLHSLAHAAATPWACAGVTDRELLRHQFFCMEYAFRVLDTRPLPQGKTGG